MATRKTTTKKVTKKSATKKAPAKKVVAKKTTKRAYKRKPKIDENLTVGIDEIREAVGETEATPDIRDQIIQSQQSVLNALVSIDNKPLHVQLSSRGDEVFLDLAHQQNQKNAFGIAAVAHMLGVDGYVLRNAALGDGSDLNAGTPSALINILYCNVLRLNTVNKVIYPANESALPEGTQLLRIDGDVNCENPVVTSEPRFVAHVITVDGVNYRRNG